MPVQIYPLVMVIYVQIFDEIITHWQREWKTKNAAS